MAPVSNQDLPNKTQALKDLYSALNRNDISVAVRSFDPQIERVEFEGHPSGGRFRGFAAVEEHFRQGRATWAEGECKPERFIVAGEKILVLVHVRVRLKKTMEWVEGRVADVYTFRSGMITEMRSFMDQGEALTWAGAAVSNRQKE
jgi:ketosteroid isomerase-like protein